MGSDIKRKKAMENIIFAKPPKKLYLKINVPSKSEGDAGLTILSSALLNK
jgi:hypothetical protein